MKFRETLGRVSRSKISSIQQASGARLSEQFVRENAQAIDRRGFYSKNNRAEGDRLGTMATRQRKLGRREVALRSNEHQNASRPIAVFTRISCQDFLQVLGIRLKGSD